MKKVAVILAQGFEEAEALVPIDIMRRAGLEVDILGLDTLKVKGAHEIVVESDFLLTEKKDFNYSSIVLPGGGEGSLNLSESFLVEEFIKKGLTQGCLVGAICAAPSLVLAQKGFLDNKKYVGYPASDLPYERGFYQKELSLMKDGSFLTAKSMAYACDFGLSLVVLLKGEEEAFKIAKSLCYDEWSSHFLNSYQSFLKAN